MEVFVGALNLGLMLALLALSYSLTFGVLRVINFALGEAFMLGGLLTLLEVRHLGIATLPGIFMAGVLVALSGIIIYFIAFHILMRRSDFNPIQPLLSSLGVSFIMQNAVMLWFDTGSVPFGNAVTSPIRALIDIIILFLTGYAVLWFVVERTKWGLWMKALRDNRILAWDMGIPVAATGAVTFALSYFVAGLAGGIWMAYSGVFKFDMGFVPGLKAFSAAVVGGMGDLAGGVAGGVGIGMAEYFISRYITLAYKDVLSFLLMIIILVIRPKGLFNRGIER